MQQLPQHYQRLQDTGFRIITLSSDQNELVFKNASRGYPWADKYCDFEGMNGINFKNYAIDATPTIYVLDKTGKIINKLATMEQIVALINTPKK